MTIKVITISGEIASGKSTIAGQLAQALPGWTRINTGQKFREFCEGRGISIQQVSYLPDEVHKEFDDYQEDLAESGHNLIIEGRLSGWLARDLKDVLRVYCTAPVEVRVSRYMAREKVTKEQSYQDIYYRDQNDLEKFRRLYGVHDYRDPSFYSLVIDTSKFSAAEAVNLIVKEANKSDSI